MFKLVALCALLACSQAAPTDKPVDSNSTVAAGVVVTEKSLPHDIEVVSVKTFSADKRDKREDDSASPPANDNERTPSLSQPDYQENKPPTFVFPVPVDQIIKHSNASPEIHNSKHNEAEEREDDGAEPIVKENVDVTNEEDQETEQQPKPKHVHHKHTFRTHAQSDDESEDNQ